MTVMVSSVAHLAAGPPVGNATSAATGGSACGPPIAHEGSQTAVGVVVTEHGAAQHARLARHLRHQHLRIAAWRSTPVQHAGERICCSERTKQCFRAGSQRTTSSRQDNRDLQREHPRWYVHSSACNTSSQSMSYFEPHYRYYCDIGGGAICPFQLAAAASQAHLQYVLQDLVDCPEAEHRWRRPCALAGSITDPAASAEAHGAGAAHADDRPR
jgi:hypothetical protein